jgi:transcriptional regulator with XRE-family HTH domain
VGVNTIIRIERGERASPHTLANLSRALGVSPDALLEEDLLAEEQAAAEANA